MKLMNFFKRVKLSAGSVLLSSLSLAVPSSSLLYGADKDDTQRSSENTSDVNTLAQGLITEDMMEKDRSYIFDALSKVPDPDRQSFIQDVQKLFTEDMNGYVRSGVILGFSHIPAADRQSFVQQVQELITEDMNGYKDSVVLLLSRIPAAADRQSFVQQVQELITEDMHRIDRVDLICDLSHIPAFADRESFVQQVQGLITEDMNMNGDDRFLVTRTLFMAPNAERAERAGRARNNMDLPANHTGFVNRLRQLLETPIDQQIPPLDGGMEAGVVAGGYAYGINVHAGRRDSKTEQAINLFLNHQKGIELNVIMDSYQALITIIESLPEGDRKKYIKQTLGMIEAPGFGGFLTGYVSIYDADMKPQEFLGRLWYFITQIKDQKDQDNAKASLLSSLADGVEKDRQVVCNAGKLQRMIIAVLQGRLANVDIDGVNLEVSLPPEQKQKIDDKLLVQYRDEGLPNANKLIKELELQSTEEEENVKIYIKKRLQMVHSLPVKPDIKDALAKEYDTEKDAEAAIEKILKSHTDITEDAFLSKHIKNLILSRIVNSKEESAASRAGRQS